jgi:hypothetical protein
VIIFAIPLAGITYFTNINGLEWLVQVLGSIDLARTIQGAIITTSAIALFGMACYAILFCAKHLMTIYRSNRNASTIMPRTPLSSKAEGFRRLTWVLSILAAVTGVFITIAIAPREAHLLAIIVVLILLSGGGFLLVHIVARTIGWVYRGFNPPGEKDL